MALVFQYGSNTSSSRFNADNRLRGDARDMGLYRTVLNFDLAFDVWSEGNQCAASDLVAGKERQAWGVLYEVPDHLMSRETSGARRSMDAIEGTHYQRVPIQICSSDGQAVEGPVVTYTVSHPRTGFLTSFEYASHIITGLREHGAPADYIDYVKARVLLNNPTLAPDLDRL